ncbi:hypothetical protein OIU84_028429 [Salix udensis]|uniref:Uncharacterized protein n=1 Tax=Salix udensis TaxID=889485 RepID=A0AAD6KCX2_9ROSI|nr:hypothetical protein OIU84_028429 [Salix udensis]
MLTSIKSYKIKAYSLNKSDLYPSWRPRKTFKVTTALKEKPFSS